MDSDRMGGWLRERDGDLNPTLLLMTLYAVAGLAFDVAAVWLLVTAPAKAIVSMPGLLIHNATMAVILGIGWYQMGRAKLLANSKAVAAGLTALGQTGGYDRDERDEDQIAAMEGHREGR